jgi:hypothetical protein
MTESNQLFRSGAATTCSWRRDQDGWVGFGWVAFLGFEALESIPFSVAETRISVPSLGAGCFTTFLPWGAGSRAGRCATTAARLQDAIA